MSDLTTGSPPAQGDDALLHDSEERLSLLLAATPDAVTFKDGAGRWLGANDAGLAVWGFTGTEWRGKDDAELAQLLPAFRDAFLECRRTDEEAWQRGTTTRTDEVIGLPDGSSRTFDVIKMPLFWPDGRRRVLIILARDVTDRVAVEAELLRHAFFDRLTGLPNRALLVDRLGVALRRAAGRADRPCAVLSLDVDRFSTVNDGIGHHAGDALLRQVARRLTAVAGPETTVARLSADEFSIVLDEVSGAGEAVRAADRLRHAFEQPFVVEGRKVALTASVGVALGGVAESTTEDVLRDAHTALERAKESGRDATALFDEEMHRRAVERLMLESELAHALERGQLQMHYQPVFDLAQGRIAGFEALARWEHPELGLLLPAAFIPVAEETGSIHSVGRWSMREAVGALGRFTRAAGRELTMAVNCSPRQLLHPSFPDELEAFVAEAGVPPHLLRLEITEGSFVDRPELAAIVLARIRHLGIEVDLDDFGTGYSSLAYLLRLPVDAIKIDRSFVGGLPGTESAVKIARTVLLLARSLGLATIAEGVETPGQLQWLHEHGCDLAQGFLLGAPVPEAGIGDLGRPLATP